MGKGKKILILLIALMVMWLPAMEYVDAASVSEANSANETNVASLTTYFGGVTSTEYSPELALNLMGLADAAYDQTEVNSKLANLGCSKIVTKEYYENPSDPAYGSDNCAYAIGSKKAEVGNKTLVIIAIRGSVGGISPGSSDWQSNFNINITGKGNHLGFETAAGKILKGAEAYVDSNKIKNPVYVITGHSRGAAVANLLAVSMVEQGEKTSDVYAYTFATPDVTINESKIGNYPNIFNVCNTSDVVTVLPRVAETVKDERVDASAATNAKQMITMLSVVYPSLTSKASSKKWFKNGTTLWFTEGTFGTDSHNTSKYIEHLQNLDSIYNYELEGAPPISDEEGTLYPEQTNPNSTVVEPTEEAETLGNLVDVTTADYFYEPVKWAIEKGITTGTSGYTFSPEASCTRAQAVTFLWRAAGSPEPERDDNSFVDVSQTDYFYKAVLWAREKGITSGISEGVFAPNLTCTRAQIVTFMYRARTEKNEVDTNSELADSTINAKDWNETEEVIDVTAKFVDVAKDAYYLEAVKWALAENITSGLYENAFGPDSSCKRGQIVTFLYRSYK